MFRIRMMSRSTYATRELPAGTTREQAMRWALRLATAMRLRHARSAVALWAWDRGEWRQANCHAA
jgi:hypothetical protein